MTCRIGLGSDVGKKIKAGGLEDVTLRLSRPSVHGGNSWWLWDIWLEKAEQFPWKLSREHWLARATSWDCLTLAGSHMQMAKVVPCVHRLRVHAITKLGFNVVGASSSHYLAILPWLSGWTTSPSNERTKDPSKIFPLSKKNLHKFFLKKNAIRFLE